MLESQSETKPETALGVADMLRIRGARTHNLQSVDVDLPRGRLTVITGVSGSGKSSLAFDTLFAESQRRYLECLSEGARVFLRQLPRPDVDEISGLAPAVCIDQRSGTVSARSTVAVTTEVHDFLRVLYARGGTPHCPQCGQSVQSQAPETIVERVLQLPERTRLMVLSPLVRQRRGSHREVLERIMRHGFVRARIDGETVEVDGEVLLTADSEHTIEAVVDRLVIREGVAARLRESIDLACRESDGTCIICHEQEGTWHDTMFSTCNSCAACDLDFPTPEPRLLSFGSARGACPACRGLGIRGAAEGDETIVFRTIPCGTCSGNRLQAFPAAIQFLGVTLPEFCRLSVAAAEKCVRGWIGEVSAGGSLTQESRLVAERVLPDLLARLQCLLDTGVGYLTLDRSSRTLSGGEYQRARLASCLALQLHGAHYILDEPTAGLHPRDTQQLLQILIRLRDTGATVIVVEHDPLIVAGADWLIDLGPGAGRDGGQLLYAGPVADYPADLQTPTGELLRQRSAPAAAGTPVIAGEVQNAIRLTGASIHNLQGVDAVFPLGRMTAVTGVSGSGKSSLVTATLVPLLRGILQHQRAPEVAAADVDCRAISGHEIVQRISSLDQGAAGRSSRSCLATLTPIWKEVRRLLTRTREARARGLNAGYFSFNSGAGRCRECRGSGQQQIRMALLPEAIIPCPACGGQRFSKEALTVLFRGCNVSELLQMRVDEACEFFSSFATLTGILEAFREIGLGYLSLGQPSSTFSGGELQRVRIAGELAVPADVHTLYVLDEPTNGLHVADINRLSRQLRRLADAGHTVVVVEHSMELIRGCDWVLDLGPEAASAGGRLMFSGTPAELQLRGTGATADALRG